MCREQNSRQPHQGTRASRSKRGRGSHRGRFAEHRASCCCHSTRCHSIQAFHIWEARQSRDSSRRTLPQTTCASLSVFWSTCPFAANVSYPSSPLFYRLKLVLYPTRFSLWMTMMPITCKEAMTRLVHYYAPARLPLISLYRRTTASLTLTMTMQMSRRAQMLRICTTPQSVRFR